MGSISSKTSYRTETEAIDNSEKKKEDPEFIVKCKVANKAWYDRNRESTIGEKAKLKDTNFLIETIKKIQQDINDRFNTL